MTEDANRLTLALEQAGYSPEHSRIWAAFLLDPSSPPTLEGEPGRIRLPLQDFNTELLRLANLPEVNKTRFFHLCKTFAHRLIPEPENIDSWKQVVDLLMPHTDLISQKTKYILIGMEANETFQKGLADTPPKRSFADWKKLASCGEVFDALMMSLSAMHRNRDMDTPLVRSYLAMVQRLRSQLDSAAVSIDPDVPKMIVTAHSRFRGHMVAPLTRQYTESLYSLVADSLKTTQQVNTQRIVMLKKLKKGVSVMIAPDGKKGNHNAKGFIFDREVNISDGFAWVAWNSKCPVHWAFAIPDDQGQGLKAYSEVLLESPDAEVDFETFAAQLVAAYLTAIENAILRYPFGFGLIFPRRIGDRAPRTKS